jgi:hypothetical protein
METIESLSDLKPGDIMFGPIGGLTGLGVGIGQLALREAFRVGRLSIRHVGIVVEASRTLSGPSLYDPGEDRYLRLEEAPGPLRSMEEAEDLGYVTYPYGVKTAPRLVQAMPGGAEEIELRWATHWTARHAYVRMPQDYQHQADDAAAIARAMVAEKVAYSFASYAALAAWRWGLRTPRLERWIGRRRALKAVPNSPGQMFVSLPCEAICSVLVDQAWSLAGKRVMEGVPHQVVTPGALAKRLWNREMVWGGEGL